MKKRLCLAALMLACVSLLSACGAEASAALMKSGTSGTLRITDVLWQRSYLSSDNRVTLGSYSYTLPSMTDETGDAAQAKIADAFNAGVETMANRNIREWDSAMEDAEDYYNSLSSGEWSFEKSGWTDQITYEMSRTDGLVSLRYAHYSYAGGAHGYTDYTSQLFDLQEGKFITLAALTEDAGALKETVAEEILRQIDENHLAVSYGYWSDYATYVDQWMDAYSTYFNEDGALEVIFPAYELASYAAGAQAFTVSQEVYAPCLNDYGRQLLGISQ